MSLHSLANHLQSAGRGEDKVLVHMTPGEVKGLQSLAMAHGGSLTVNPQTGLPEAGILKSLLPMLAGFALGPAGLGMTALNAGLTTAAVGAATTGSLKKGLLAGLGAYSGAGLGAGLQSMANPAGAAGGQGLTATNAGVGLQNTGAGVGLRAPGAAPSLGGTNVGGYSGYAGLDSGLTNVPGASGLTNVPKLSGPPPVDAATVSVRPPADTYFDPSRAYDPSGSLSGSRAAADVKGFGAQRDYSRGLLGKRASSVVDIDDVVPVEFNPALTPSASVPAAASSAAPFKMPEGATGWSGNSSMGYKYYGPNARELVPTSTEPFVSPIGKDAKYFADINRKIRTSPAVSELASRPPGRIDIPVDPTMTEPASITQYTRPFTDRMAELGRGAKASFGSVEGLKGLYAASEAAAPYGMYAGLGSTAYSMYEEEREKAEEEARRRAAANQGMIRPYEFSYGTTNVSGEPYSGSAERTYFQPTYTAGTPYKAPGPEYAASGGLMGYAAGGSIEDMAAQNVVGQNTGYPMANLQTPMYSNPGMQRPEATNVIAPSADAGVGTYSGEQRFRSGGTATPETTGEYSYNYDPKTMQFTQTGAPQPVATNRPSPVNPNGGPAFMGPTGSGYYGAGSYSEGAKLPGSKILTQALNQPTTPNGTVSGGIATPVMQPAAPMQSFAPTTTVPAYQTPEQQLGLGGFYDYMNQQMGGYGGYAAGGNVGGGMSHLGDYSDGGRLLKGPGDGVSDSIPASIGNRQPARLADGEFVVPARIVSEIGNGSTEAGARKLYAMMARVQKARRKTTGKNQVAANTKAERLLPA